MRAIDESRAVAQRLSAQRIARHDLQTPAELVARLGAVQAQDYGASKWAIGLRLPRGAREEQIERALGDGTIVRMHSLRGTWQIMAPGDVRWILALVAAKSIARAERRHRDLGLDEATFRRANAALAKALASHENLSRAEVTKVLQGVKVSAEKERLMHVLWRAELESVLCGGPRRGKQPTYTLLDRVLGAAEGPSLSRSEGAAELARRYFQTRGPATLADFTWWSGLSVSEARAALEAVQSSLEAQTIGGTAYFSAAETGPKPSPPRVYLLPAFDEYLIAYRDRALVLAPEHSKRLNAGGGMLGTSVVYAGKVIGTWKRTLGTSKVVLETDLFEEPDARIQRAIAKAVEELGAFLGVSAALV